MSSQAIALFQSRLQNHHWGILLVVISAIVFSSAGIFSKAVSADGWTIIFWRGLAAAGFTLAYLASRGQLIHEIHCFSWPALWVSVLMAAGTAAFIPAFKLTSVAHVAMIYAAAPFVAVGLSWWFLRERPESVVILASLAAIAGVAIIVSSSVGGTSITGDMLAGFMTLTMSAVLVVYRRWPQTTAALPAVLSSIMLLPVAAVQGNALSVLATELPLLVCFGLVFAIASVTFSEGARRLPSAQAALLSILEMPLAPLLAWWILAEVPGVLTLTGGLVILVAVIWSQLVANY